MSDDLNFVLSYYRVDFFSYAQLDLVDRALSAIHTNVVKRKYDEAMPLLEALTVFSDLESSWPSKHNPPPQTYSPQKLTGLISIILIQCATTANA